ncbi:hypothetical protein I4U23_020209 [Adineta vaga]|nr:hypothetical protein I4U23_020209 [Adineta vaga]
MNKLPIILAFISCIFIGSIVTETQFEFPAQACATGLLTGTYVACIGALADSIWKVHQWGEDTPITICGNPCTGNLKGRISKLKWKWDAKFQCPNKAVGTVGESSALSRDGSMKGAIQDWINKASQTGLVKAEDFKC